MKVEEINKLEKRSSVISRQSILRERISIYSKWKDINTEEVRDFIRSKAPQLVVVSGAPLLKKIIIDAVEGRIINLHPGYAPEYRGRYGAYWPVYNKEPELVGVTVHFVDSGIDTGKILLQQQIDFNPNDTLKIVTYKQQATGVALLVKCLSEFDKIAPARLSQE